MVAGLAGVEAGSWLDGCRMVGCELLLWCLGPVDVGAAIGAEGRLHNQSGCACAHTQYTTQTVCDQARRVVAGEIRQSDNVWADSV